MLRAGGSLGLVAVILEFFLFIFGCLGFDHAFVYFPIVPLLLSAAGIVMSLIGGIWRTPVDEDPHVLFALFSNTLGLTGALLEVAVWRGWSIYR